MFKCNTPSLSAKNFVKLICQSNGSMLASGTSEGNGEIVFSLLNVTRHQPGDYLLKPVYKFLGYILLEYILSNFFVVPGEFLKAGYIVRVRYKPHIYYPVSFCGNPVLISEGHKVEPEAVLLCFADEKLVQLRVELSNLQVGGIYDKMSIGSLLL